MVKEINLRVSPKEAASIEILRKKICESEAIAPADLHDLRIVRRSIDARQRRVMVNLTVRYAYGDDYKIGMPAPVYEWRAVPYEAPRVVIVGAGPAGLFAALQAIMLGWRPIVLERGFDVDKRRLDLARISREKKINPSSNYCFGEGGAGAYSDGKLFTRSKKRGDVSEVLRLLVAHGASPDIFIDAHPHIGSDKLPEVIKNIRHTIISCGGEVHFNALVTGLVINEGKVEGVRLEDGSEFLGKAVVLATGHSAHDTFRLLADQGIPMQPKGIAVGVRLEHPQELIDQLQYHSPEGRGKYLPAAEYSYVTQVDGRGVYSFCMCPGGVVVPAGSTDGELVVNGMSASARAGRWANSGMVVEVRPGDFKEFADYGPLEILEFQEALEKRMFEAADNSIIAPAQRMKDFVDGKISESLPGVSYAPGVRSKDFNELLPSEISSRLRKGFIDFGRRSPGFLTNKAVMIGLESRTSSPIRIPRNRETFEAEGLPGLYPAGEGPGYAGGIVSAALDGMNCVRAAANKSI
ncbi:MAG: FAD-binding protein [Muribaculaceae bacterium]|nr:FAD-binding protein [Muribaculaceae bacterium]